MSVGVVVRFSMRYPAICSTNYVRSVQSAEGHVQCCGGVAADEMTKRFDLKNYHYIVPELSAGMSFELNVSRQLGQLTNAWAPGAPPPLLNVLVESLPQREGRGRIWTNVLAVPNDDALIVLACEWAAPSNDLRIERAGKIWAARNNEPGGVRRMHRGFKE